MIGRLLSTFVITSIVRWINLSSQNDPKELHNLLDRNSLRIDIENKEECSLKYDKMMTHFRHVYLVQCGGHAKTVRLNLGGESKKEDAHQSGDTIKKGGTQQIEEPNEKYSAGKKSNVAFFNERGKKITKDNIILKLENNRKIIYKVCQMENPPQCIFIYVIISFKFDVMRLRELLLSNYTMEEKEGAKLNMLHRENVKVGNINEYLLQHFLLDSRKVIQFYEISANVTNDDHPLYLYASSHTSNFVYVDRNLRNLLKEENYQYETYFYKFRCSDNFQIFAATSDTSKENFFVYRLVITCNGGSEGRDVNEISNGGRRDFSSLFDVSFTDPTFIIPPFRMDEFKYDVFTPDNNFWLRISSPNVCHPPSNITLNDKRVITEYNLITLNEHMDELFYDDCIEQWKLLQKKSSVQEDKNCWDVKKRQDYLIFGNVHDGDASNCSRKCKTDLFAERIELENSSWQNIFSSKRKIKFRNHEEINKVIFPTKRVFILKYTKEAQKKQSSVGAYTMNDKTKVIYFFFYIHKIPANIIVNSFAFIAFLKNANCAPNNICHLENDGQPSYIQVVFKKRKNKRLSYFSTNLLLTQNNENFRHYIDKRDNLKLFINNENICDNIKYSIKEIGSTEERINIKIVDQNNNILYNTDLIIIRKNVFYKFALQLLSYFSYAYIISCFCLHTATVLKSIQFVQILTLFNIKYDALPPLYNYFLKKLNPLSFISHVFDVKVYRKSLVNQFAYDAQLLTWNSATDPHTTNGDDNLEDGHIIKEKQFVQSERRHYYGGKLSQERDTGRGYFHGKANKMMESNIKGDNLQKDNHYDIEEETLMNETPLEDYPPHSASKADAVAIKKKYHKKKSMTNQRNQKWEDEIMFLHTLVSTLLNIIIILLLLTSLYFVYSKYIQRKVIAEIIPMPFFSRANFVPLIYDLFVFPVIFITTNIVVHDSGYHAKVYFLHIDIYVLKFVSIVLLFCYVLSYVLLSLHVVLSVKRSTTYSCYLQRFIPLSISRIRGIVTKPLPFQFLFNDTNGIYLPSRLTLLRSAAQGKSYPSYAFTNQHVKGTGQIHKEEIHPFFFSLCPRRVSEAKRHVTNNTPLKRIIRSYVDKQRGKDRRIDLSHHQPLLQDIELSVPGGKDTTKKGSRKHISSKRLFPKNVKSPNGIITPNGDQKGDTHDGNNDGDLGHSCPERDTRNNPVKGRNIAKVFKNAFCILDRHISEHQLDGTPFDSDSSYPASEKYQAQLSSLRENEPLSMGINKYICKSLGVQNQEHKVDHQIGASTQIKIHHKREDKKCNLSTLAENLPTICLTKCIKILHHFSALFNQSKYKISYAEAVKKDAWRNKLLRVTITRASLNHSIHSSNGTNEKDPNLHFLTHDEDTHIGYLYDKVSLFKKTLFVKKAVKLKHVYFLLFQKKEIQLFVNKDQICDDTLGIYSLLTNNCSNENASHFFCVRLITVICITTVNLSIRNDVLFTLFSLSLFFFALFVYNFSSILKPWGGAESWEQLGEYQKEETCKDKKKATQPFTHDGKLSSGKFYLGFDNVYDKNDQDDRNDSDNAKRDLSHFKFTQQDRYNEWMKKDMLTDETSYSELVLSVILFFLLLSNMFTKKGENSQLFSLLLSLLTTSLCVNIWKVKNAFHKIIIHANYYVATKWHSAYFKTYAMYFLHVVEQLCDNFIQWIVTIHCNNKDCDIPTGGDTTRKTGYANLFSYFRNKIFPNYNGVTFKNLKVDKLKIHHQEKDIDYKYEALTLDDNCKNVFKSELRKNFYVIGKMNFTKLQEGLSNVPVYIHNDSKKNRKYYICSIDVVDDENHNSRKSLSLYIKGKDKKGKKIFLHSSRRGDLLWTSTVTRQRKPSLDYIPTYGKLPSEGRPIKGGKTDTPTNKATDSHVPNTASSAKAPFGQQTGERIKVDKYSYTLLGKDGLTIRSLFIKPNKTYRIQPVFKEKHLKCEHSKHGNKSKSPNLSLDNSARIANSYLQDLSDMETFPKLHKNWNSHIGCGKWEELSNEGFRYSSSNSQSSGEDTHRNGNRTAKLSIAPHICSRKKGRKFKGDKGFRQFHVVCEDIGTLIITHDINYVDTLGDIKVENEYGETFCLNSIQNCITFIKKKKIVILSHPCFYKNETYYVYLRGGGQKFLSDYLTEGIYVQSSPNGEIILTSFSQNKKMYSLQTRNDQRNTDITDSEGQNFSYKSRTLLDDQIHMYKITDHKKKKKFFFVKVHKQSNIFYAQSYLRRKCKNSLVFAFMKQFFCSKYDNLQEEQPIDDFLEEINQTDFVPIQVLYKLKESTDVAAAKKLQNYFIECLNESPILCKGDDKYGEVTDVAYELLTTSEVGATRGKKKTYGGSSIVRCFEKNKNWFFPWRKFHLLSGREDSTTRGIVRSISSHLTNGIFKKEQPKKHGGTIHTQDGRAHQNRNHSRREGLLHLCKRHLIRRKKTKGEILYRYAANYKDLIKTYNTHIKIYESKYNYVKHNKGNIKVLADILLELLSFPYILDVFQRYNILDKREGENFHHYGNNISFNIYSVYEKCSLNKKQTFCKIVNYLEELATHKIMYIITFYKEKLNYLHLLDKMNMDVSVCNVQRNIDRMFYHRFRFSKRGMGRTRDGWDHPTSRSIAISTHDSSSDRNGSRCLATNGNPTQGNGNTLKGAPNERIHEKTLHEVILERYIKRRKSFGRKFYEIKKSIREIAEKYRQEEQGTKKILFHFPFFIHKKKIIKMKKNVEQQIYEWNACLTNFFSNFLNHSLTKTHICHYNLRILNKHILNSIKHSMFAKRKNAKLHFSNVNFVHVVIPLSFLNPQKALLLSPTFFYMKYSLSKPIFVLCNQDDIGSFLGEEGGRVHKERGDSPKWEESSYGGTSLLGEDELSGMEREEGDRKKTRREKSKRCNAPRRKKNALPKETKIDLEKKKQKEHILLPCYLEIVNDHLLIYLFDNYDNKLCWKIERGNYSLETREMIDRNGEKEAKYATDERKKKGRCTTSNNGETVTQTLHPSEEGHSNYGTPDKVKSELVYAVISTDENEDTAISSLIKKKEKTIPKYKRLEEKNESSQKGGNYLAEEKNCFVKCVRMFSNFFRNLQDSWGRNLCLLCACYEGQENKLHNGNSDYIKLIVKINPAVIPKLSKAITINDHAWEKLTEENKLLIQERIEEVCLDIKRVLPRGGGDPPEMDPNFVSSDEMLTRTKKDHRLYSKYPNENVKMEEFALPDGVPPPDGKLSGEPPLSSTHVIEKEFANEEWHELQLYTFSFYKNKLSELITNYTKSLGMETSNSSENRANAHHDVGLDIIEKRDSINEAWRYDHVGEETEKEYDGRKEEERNISYLLKGIERMRSTTFIKKKFMEDSEKSTHKELIFYDKNQQLFCKYVGDMKNKFYNGHGKLYDKFNSLIYDGQWLNGQKHGKGKLLFKYFNIWYLYEGQFSNDEIVDKGIISLIDKEYVKRIQSDKINKLCPLLIKVNFGKYKWHKTVKGAMEESAQFEKELIKQIEKTVMQNYTSNNNVDFWPKEITDIYFPYLRKWNIYSFYCSCNIENIKDKKEIFESNENNFKNLIGYPSFELRNGKNDLYLDQRPGDDDGQADSEGTPGENYPKQTCREAEGKCDSPNQSLPNNSSQEYIVHKRDKTNVLHQEFFEYMKKKNEPKLYYPLLSKTLGLAKIIYADKSEYIGPVNSKGQPNTNEQFPQAIFNNEYFFYEGEMKNFLPHGYGIFKNKKDGKNTYLGFWKNGHREGNGNLHLGNKKYIVQGNFIKDKLHSNVNIFIKDGKICKIYISSVSTNNQKIKVFFRNGYIFYGHFSENYQRNGIGILIDNNNKILYHGYYKNDMIDKFCYILRHKDNTIYCGNLYQGVKKGFGKLYYEEKLHFDDENEFNLSLSNAKILARKLESYDGIDINSEIPLNFSLDSNHVIYVGYWDENHFSHFGSCNLRNGIYKGEIKDSKKDGFGIYIYKNKKSYKNKNRYVLSYFKKDKISSMGKYYNEYDKLKVHSFHKEQIKRKKSAYDKCFTKGKIKYDILKTDKLYINQEIDYYITVPLSDTLSVIMDEVLDKSTSFVHYLYRPFRFDLNYFLKK
ncbi:conserved Plasmodium protein, unknown function [Plasmodium knowlesi strain H]|uniref:Uncharacterized protein n=3 Tax=Plasmodium knowlesi TaxID=5850 RepID=A0A5K1VF58_PLAKH|nr:MORN repeat protein, putative [Plasmodium knowlesi strain H]OTN63636.1 Uncharacterized protein PKNOH_S140223800 [Plasmodium knowlesi]CAA9990666.1 MORN repeat protein, putative [Plasmodium knowlesi strain H]SBO25959.1 conserved Plasmodium protein, unknown function [Plasmodium knowlesi strain H]SBO28692.1 conserved Plasmodium protein, unknown function [Plasmodium knowlesi strain H]VVS80140.1 MORN repeat protein, putative [Plasmodium knowlesi strain H]|eukprot:XP_002261957.1 hypothetical protein, conserved in Plasmodium species [Plasmodium knowlesi strain H]